MSFELAINVKNLSKIYQIYDQPRERLYQFIFPKLRRLFGMRPKQYYREFWALKNISFEVKRGEIVGILGKNGVGKSTLLQLICGILNPSNGTVVINGRVAAILELGSGFNPECTGHENIFLNAAIYGLTKSEINKYLDKILDFADIGDHISQPIKTYSSGMIVRLAFSIAVMSAPDILVIDEALAVGDGAFQLKCMNRIKELQEMGCTILYVSHDLNSIARLCTSVHILNEGIKLPSESVFDSIRTYERILKLDNAPVGANIPVDSLKQYKKRVYLESEYSPESIGSQEAIIAEIDLLDLSGYEQEVFESGSTITLRLKIISLLDYSDITVGFGVRSTKGVRVIGGNNQYSNTPLSVQKGLNLINIKFNLNLVAGEYFINIGIVDSSQDVKDLDQRWGVRKLVVTSLAPQVGISYSEIYFEKV
jgi:lipopolysaccharide transport system ATP-binding protein